MPGFVTTEAIPVRREPNSFQVHDVLDMPLPRAVAGFAVRVVTRCRLLTMAGVTVFRPEQLVGTRNVCCPPVALLVTLRQHPGAREERDEKSEDDTAPDERSGATAAPGSLVGRRFSTAAAFAQSSGPSNSLPEATPFAAPSIPASPRISEPSVTQRISESSASKEAP